MDSLESQGVLVDPYKHNIPVKLISPSFLKIKVRAKDKELEDCDISEIRWIISPSQLNPYLRQLQTNNITKEDLFIFKSEKPFCTMDISRTTFIKTTGDILLSKHLSKVSESSQDQGKAY